MQRAAASADPGQLALPAPPPCESSQLAAQSRVAADRRGRRWGSTPEPYPGGCDAVYIISSCFSLPRPNTFHPRLPLGNQDRVCFRERPFTPSVSGPAHHWAETVA